MFDLSIFLPEEAAYICILCIDSLSGRWRINEGVDLDISIDIMPVSGAALFAMKHLRQHMSRLER